MTLKTPRDRTLDIAKGIAIIAIVLGHVLRGLGAADLLDTMSAGYKAADRSLYMCHLTVFAFLSGLFVARGVHRDTAKGYLANRLTNFLYLYMVWQLLQVLVKLGTASLVNSAPETAALVEFWIPEGQMWFMPWLMIATTIAVVARPWGKGSAAWVGIAAVAVVSIAAWGNEGPYVGTQGLSLLIFFVVGSRIQFHRLIEALSSVGTAALGFLALAAAMGYAALLSLTPALPPTINALWTPIGVFFGFVTSTVGLVLVISLSGWLSRLSLEAKRFGWLAFLGVHSLEIFLAHIIAGSGTRIVLSQLGVVDPAVHIAAGLIAGLVMPLLLWWALSRIGWNWLFQRPTRPQSKVEA